MRTVLAKTSFDGPAGRILRHLRRRHNDLCINIVTYHSVASERTILTCGTDLRHDPDAFERQIDFLAERYHPVSLRELVSALERGDPPARSVVITLDDGYADSLRTAAPILFRRRVPVTVFPATSVIGNADLLWQHKLAWLVASGHAAWVDDALRAEGYPPRGGDEAVLHFTRRCFRADLPAILESLLRRAGRSGQSLARELRPYVEPEEIENADPEFVEFGNHTHTHPVLSALSEDEQQREIQTARDVIQSLTGRMPLALAYPFGLKRHYDSTTRRIVREAGHKAALDLRRRMNVGRVDPFELSRKPATCGPQGDFERLIEDWPVNAPMFPPGVRP